MKAALGRILEKWHQMVEKQGFPIVITVCVCVITATALWTKKQEAPAPGAVKPMQDVSAAQLQQEALRDASSPAPAPTAPPQRFAAPLDAYTLLTPFSITSMRKSSVTGVWAVHDAVDLQAADGTPVLALADGMVTGEGQDQLQGVWVSIDHGSGVEAVYAGMKVKGEQGAGDRVRQGDIIGYVGNGMLTESDLPPHLHLRITMNGASVDPLTLFD